MRLNRFIASTGVTSRRKADELIREGRVTVNGRIARIGQEIDPEKDHVKLNGKLIHAAVDKLYVLLNKPAGYLCSLKDPSKRPLVTDLLPEFSKVRLFTVGRLDFNSEGLILLTNDGDFAARVGHPASGPEKTYMVRVRGVPDERALEKLRRGIRVEGTKTRPAKVSLVRKKENAWLEVTIKEGRNRQIRKMFQALGHPVVRLKRTKIGWLKDTGIKPGRYRLLTHSEIDRLKK